MPSISPGMACDTPCMECLMASIFRESGVCEEGVLLGINPFVVGEVFG